MENSSLNKRMYKLFISIVKYIPMFMAVVQTFNMILKYFGINMLMLSFLGGISFPMLGVLFIISYVFRYCYLYRVPLYYLLMVGIITSIDAFVGIPLETLDMFRIYFINTGIFLIIFVYQMYKNRHNLNTKIDYIKNLCDRYNCK